MLNYAFLGRVIQEIRKKRGMTQEELASSVDISKGYLSELERGKRHNVSLNVLDGLAKALDVNLYTMLTQSNDDIPWEDLDDKTETSIFIHNYGAQNESYRISTFVQLFMVLPLFDFAQLTDIYCHVGGDFVGNEQYIYQQINRAYDRCPTTPAKMYVSKILDIISSKPWEHVSDISPMIALKEKSYDTFDNDQSFSQSYEDYIALVECKNKLAKTKEFYDYMFKKYDAD